MVVDNIRRRVVVHHRTMATATIKATGTATGSGLEGRGGRAPGCRVSRKREKIRANRTAKRKPTERNTRAKPLAIEAQVAAWAKVSQSVVEVAIARLAIGEGRDSREAQRVAESELDRAWVRQEL